MSDPAASRGLAVRDHPGTWSVAQVAVNHELRVADRLREIGIGTFVPSQRIIVYRHKCGRPVKEEFDRPLWRGYVFACWEHDHQRGDILCDRGVYRMMRVIDQERLVSELQQIELCMGAGKSLTPEEWRPGQRVKVVAGPLMGTEGDVISQGPRRLLQIGVRMLSTYAVVEIEPELLEPI